MLVNRNMTIYTNTIHMTYKVCYKTKGIHIQGHFC